MIHGLRRDGESVALLAVGVDCSVGALNLVAVSVVAHDLHDPGVRVALLDGMTFRVGPRASSRAASTFCVPPIGTGFGRGTT